MRMTQLQVNQTIEDIAISKCGTAELAFDLAIANGINISDQQNPGVYLSLPSIAEESIVGYFDNRIVQPATAIVVSSGRVFDETFDETFE